MNIMAAPCYCPLPLDYSSLIGKLYTVKQCKSLQHGFQLFFPAKEIVLTDKSLGNFSVFLNGENLIFPSHSELLKCTYFHAVNYRSSPNMACNHSLPWREHLTQLQIFKNSDIIDVIRWPYTCEKGVLDVECALWYLQNAYEGFVTHEEFSELLSLIYVCRH